MNPRVRDFRNASLTPVTELNRSRPETTILSALLQQALQNSPAAAVALRLDSQMQSGLELRAAYTNLAPTDRDQLTRSFGEHNWNELLSLSSERDPQLFGEGLFAFGQRQEQQGRLELAAVAYASLAQAGAQQVEPLRQRANTRLQALQGLGSFGQRFELLARNFSHQASDPAMLLGMAAAGAFFQTARLATMSRLLASPTASFWTRGIGAEAIAWGTGSLLELPAFTFATRGAQEALGRHQDWSQTALGRDLLANGLTLFALKAAGAGGSAAMRRLQTAEGMSNAFVRFSAAAVPQLASFAGLLGAHALEVQFGLRRPSDPASAIFDSLATLLQFHVSGRLLQGLGGDATQRRLQEYQFRLENDPRLSGRPPQSPSLLPGWNPLVEQSANGASLTPEALNPKGLQVWMATRPSDRPKAASGMNGDVIIPTGSVVVGHPYQFRDLKVDLDNIEGVLSIFYRSNIDQPWQTRVKEMSHELHDIANEVHRRYALEPARAEILSYMQDLALEYRTITSLLERSAHSDNPLPLLPQMEVKRFLSYLYRSANTLINLLDHTGFPQTPVENARKARSWLQISLEGENITAEEVAPPHPHFPYQRLANGSFSVAKPNLHVLVLGDEDGHRTFELVEQGHRITHLGFDETNMRTTEKRLRYRTEQKKRSGEWLIDPNVAFQNESAPLPPADLIEAYFPQSLAELEPRSSAQRFATLQNFLDRTLNSRLAVGGSAFVIAERDEAIEDLANLVFRTPNLELLELRQRRTRLPLLGGHGATIENGEAMVSWLVFRKYAEDKSE